ncbi:hypothetical protein OM076_02850 [Solirubrobacter ginsenosidimutans]|uniref:Uncharacterized protein n=1 Tax=Solirubrobacter ginsenosidimutans TaxID=490573 RepID=A0A9X3MN08_9ACTN|nr:hypothetical protein [Solirubrobacter ginsenosidimutans]MDA0159192.1 hypothetical protein [Solirubrobacter ginsenosidimutans]
MLPRPPASAGIGELNVALPLPALPVPQLPGGNVIGVPGIGAVDLGPALAALVGAAGPLLSVKDLTADAGATGQAGTPALSGTSRIGALSALGTTLSTTDAVDRNLTLDSQTLDPSKLDVTKVLAPAGVDLVMLQNALQPVLDTLPDLAVPATALRVRTTPGEQLVSGDKLTRRALHVRVELAGTPLLDAVVGEATVDATGVGCGSIAAAALGLGSTKSGCTTRRLTLIDVVQKGGRVFLQGAADPRRFADKTVRIRSLWNRRTVATLKVPKSGLFMTDAKLPPVSLRHTNAARYRASIGTEKSLALKLERRMIVTGTRKAGTRKVTLSGRISRPLATPVQTVTVTRQVSCGKESVVARFKPAGDGRFKATLNAPRADRVYTFRFRSRVRFSTSYPTLYQTFTLPQYVVGT